MPTLKNVSVSFSFHCSISRCTACSRLSFLLFGQIAASEQEAQTTRCHVTTAVKDAKEEIVEGDIQPPSPEQLPTPTSVPATTDARPANRRVGSSGSMAGSMVQWFNGSMAGSIAQWPVQWFNGRPAQWFSGWLNGSMAGSMVHWPVQWFNGRSNGPMVYKHTYVHKGRQ